MNNGNPKPERVDFNGLLRPRPDAKALEQKMQWRKVGGEYTVWTPKSVRIEAQDMLSRNAEFLVVVDEGAPDEISFVFDWRQAGRLSGVLFNEVMHLLKRFARAGGRLRDYESECERERETPDDRCPLCRHGLTPNEDDAEDYRAIKRFLRERAERRSKRLTAIFHGEPHLGADKDAEQDDREFQKLLDEHDGRIRRRGQPPTETVD